MQQDLRLPSAGVPDTAEPAWIRVRLSSPEAGRAAAPDDGTATTTSGASDHRGRPWVLLVHGYLASMDWGFVPWLERELLDRELGVVAVTLSGSGFEDDPTRVTHAEAFGRNTYAGELADLAAVHAWLQRERPAGFDLERAAIWGHSRGSAMALVHAAEVGGYSSLCTWASVGSVGRYDPHRIVEWQANGFLTVETARGQKLRLERDLFEDFTGNAARYDLAKRAADWRAPALLVHGERDRSVPVSEAQAHARHFGGPGARVHVVGGAGHNFGTRHPCERPGPALAEALAVTGDFFESSLLPRA
jgi:pimeloyl-ACP methyl ester carboxylesterase